MDVSPALPICRQMGRSAVGLGGSAGSCARGRNGAPCPYKAPPSLADVLRLPKPPTRQAPALHDALGIGETWNLRIDLKKASCQPHQESLLRSCRVGFSRIRSDRSEVAVSLRIRSRSEAAPTRTQPKSARRAHTALRARPDTARRAPQLTRGTRHLRARPGALTAPPTAPVCIIFALRPRHIVVDSIRACRRP